MSVLWSFIGKLSSIYIKEPNLLIKSAQVKDCALVYGNKFRK